ncbi:MAG: divalent-cation tolerance protein CutA [Candidatus Binatia bacterium]
MASTDCIVVLVTVGSEEEGERIAAALVTEHLAACVNLVGPVRSIYWWEGQVQREREHLLVIKTRKRLFAKLAARVTALHSYDTPEVIALPITAGLAAYLDWLRGATRSQQG